jgi:hypothetical protein
MYEIYLYTCEAGVYILKNTPPSPQGKISADVIRGKKCEKGKSKKRKMSEKKEERGKEKGRKGPR